MCLGVPGQITDITDPVSKLAVVNIGGVKRQVNIACIIEENEPIESCIGTWVLVHVGFALNRLDEQEARETLELLKELVEAQDELDQLNTAVNL